MRTMAAVMAGLLCTLAGVRRAGALKEEAAQLSRWAVVLEHLALLIGEGALGVPEALLRCAEGRGKPDEILRSLANRLRSDPLTPLESAYAALCGDAMEQTCIRQMLRRISRGSAEERRQGVAQAQSELELMAREASGRASRDAKMYQTLGIAGGVCLMLMLI